MRITLIGAGRVAHHLAVALSAHHEIVQIFSRSLTKAQALAQNVQAQAVNDLSLLECNIDLVIIAISDSAIAATIETVHAYMPDVLCVHTSGSTDMAVLNQHHARCGVFYPLQTFSFESHIAWHNTPLLIEAAHRDDQQTLLKLAQSLSERVYVYESSQRLSLHLAAVFACNFSNYCYDLAKQVVDARGVDFALLAPLMLETAHKATQHEPHTVQTGPARRHDVGILNMHQALLAQLQQTDSAQVYRLFSELIQQRHPQ
ncbi:hypothetical protein ADP71_13790 [Vitreoscilla sp. C1]|uniref:Rossmann-like and DUF2520 domain-containing protein n=1 Tax=Vitreoscilla sp. (strain C1) TaxID=96942 RepID=UPI000CDCD523|nr:Rossmann-like and DUF2520 domain-containing protein [Vitreoscilla sp. C1]AUZ04995.1 hypothetical protein ADP71_13790 [Vitreoscilla sp. C1]